MPQMYSVRCSWPGCKIVTAGVTAQTHCCRCKTPVGDRDWAERKPYPAPPRPPAVITPEALADLARRLRPNTYTGRRKVMRELRRLIKAQRELDLMLVAEEGR